MPFLTLSYPTSISKAVYKARFLTLPFSASILRSVQARFLALLYPASILIDKLIHVVRAVAIVLMFLLMISV